MSKKLTAALALFIAPFLIIWISWIMTACSFSHAEVFTCGAFWFVTGIYWFMYLCMIGPIVELLNEHL
jgi:uncharacterized membrane protein